MYFVELVLKCIKAGGLDIYTQSQPPPPPTVMLLSSRGVIYAGQTGLEKFYYRAVELY
jgi:hypothetical protein